MKNIIPSLRRNLILQVLILASLLPGLSLFTVPLQANPSGASVVHGNVAFNGLGTSQLNIVQGSQNAIINWQSFSIQSGEVTNFIQPNQNAMALNRVTGADPSAIYGALNANGGVIVINPNGIVVGPGGRVDVAGMLTMSTLDMKNEDFLDGGSMRFRGDSSAGIKNYGAISSASGDVVLLGNFLQNSGQVSAATGTVAFGAGGDIIVNQTASGGKISVLAGGVGGENGIENTAAGEISGAAAELKAHGNVYALAIKNDGVVRANGYNFSGGKLTLSGGSRSSVINTGGLYARNANGSGGRVEISGGNVSLAGGTVDASGAPGMAGGAVSVTGDSVNVGNGSAIDVSGVTAGSVDVTGVSSAVVDGALAAVGSTGAGGSVDVTAESVMVGSTASVDVSGASQGGSARIGGGFQGGEVDIENAESVVVEEGALILADSSEGNAGRIVVWADGDTTFEGEVSARAFGQVGNGGFVEVSGKQDLYFNGLVSTLSANGVNGSLLLDPTDVVIGAAADTSTTLVDTALRLAILAGNVVIHTNSGGTDTGNITVLSGSDLTTGYSTSNSLAFFAHGDIIINDHIQNTGDGNITLFAGWDGTGAGTFGFDPTNQTPTAGTAGQPAISFDDIADANNAAVTYGEWGQNGGDVIINGEGIGAVSVGSAGGETNAFGNQVIVAGGNGNDRFGQLGFGNQLASRTTAAPAAPAIGVVDGAINIRAKDDVILSSIYGDIGGGGRNDSYVMVGHGGSNNDPGQTDFQRFGNGDLSGDISVVSESGGILMHGGNDRSFVHIGHGGQAVIGDKDGSISVEGQYLDMRGALFLNGSGDGSNRSGTMIGHGGYESDGGGSGYHGDISVLIEGSIVGVTGNINSTGNGANNIQFGHGGFNSGAVAQGSVDRDPDSFRHGLNAQVADRATAVDPTMEGHTGSVTVVANSGGIDITVAPGNNTSVQFGHGGRQSNGNHDGDIEVRAGGDFTVRRIIPADQRLGNESFVQIGNGGNRAGGAFTGDIIVEAGGNFEMHGGNNTAYAQIGHGGFADGRAGANPNFAQNNRNAHATLSGHISVNVGGNFEMYAGMGEDWGYAMVGHGGRNRTAYGVVNLNLHDDDPGNDGVVNMGLIEQTETGHHGNISVIAGEDVIMKGEAKDPLGSFNDVSGNYNFAQIGHGGDRSKGDHYGAITVEATNGEVMVQAGPGGWEVFRPNTVDDSATDPTGIINTGNLDDLDGAQTGLSNYAMIGHGGYYSHLFGDTDTSNSEFINDNGNYAGVGFGSITNAAKGINDSNVTITSGTDLSVIASQELGNFRDDQIPVAVIFDFNYPGGNPDTVAAGTIIDPSPRSLRNFAMVGHGGFGDTNNTRDPATTANNKGDIVLTAGGNVVVTGGAVQQDRSIVDYNTINPGNVQDGDNIVERNFAQIGHGGTSFQSAHEGDITLNAVGDVTLKGGNAFREAARIGHGGYDSAFDAVGTTPMIGDILLTSLGSINILGGDGFNFTAGGDVQFGYAQVGHGAGNFGQFVNDADITVTAANNITVSGGLGIRDSYGQIGHGALNRGSGDLSGTIDVTAGNDILLQSTTGIAVSFGTEPDEVAVRNYAKIGHGDTDSAGRTKSDGTWNGDILVKAGNNLTSIGGMIGHADATNGDGVQRSTSGGTFIAAGRNDPTNIGGGHITLDAGTRITSARFGSSGDLRFYLPGVGGVDNFIADGALLNTAAYTRTPFPDGTRDDEAVASEFTFVYDVDGLPTGNFRTPPEGDMQASTFGRYTIFYADLTPSDAIGGGGGGSSAPIVFDPFNFLPFFGDDKFDAFDRYAELLGYDGYDGQLFSFSAEDAREDDSDPAIGGWFFEEMLDANLGKRRDGRIAEDGTVIAGEVDEELRRRKEFAARQPGVGSASFYVFDPSTNRYSSYRVFGVPQSDLTVAQ